MENELIKKNSTSNLIDQSHKPFYSLQVILYISIVGRKEKRKKKIVKIWIRNGQKYYQFELVRIWALASLIDLLSQITILSLESLCQVSFFCSQSHWSMNKEQDEDFEREAWSDHWSNAWPNYWESVGHIWRREEEIRGLGGNGRLTKEEEDIEDHLSGGARGRWQRLKRYSGVEARVTIGWGGEMLKRRI